MRVLFTSLAVGLFAFAASAQPADDAKAPKKLTATQDQTIPGSFQVWMVTGQRPGRYQSPVCDFGLNPVVLVFAREVEGPDSPVFDLVKKLDDVAVKHVDARLGLCAVFLNDAGLRDALDRSGDEYTKQFAETAVAKQDLETKLKGTAKAKELKRAELALDRSGGPKEFPIDENAAVTVVFYYQQEIVFRKAFPKDALNEAEVKKIVGEVDKKLTELENRMRRRPLR